MTAPEMLDHAFVRKAGRRQTRSGKSAMTLIRYRPAAPLDRYVECLWWSQREAPQAYGEHMLPSGRAQLVFALHEMPIVYRSGTPLCSVAISRSIWATRTRHT
jgi:hypothetical protein